MQLVLSAQQSSCVIENNECSVAVAYIHLPAEKNAKIILFRVANDGTPTTHLASRKRATNDTEEVERCTYIDMLHTLYLSIATPMTKDPRNTVASSLSVRITLEPKILGQFSTKH